jgi:hypothetical protein
LRDVDPVVDAFLFDLGVVESPDHQYTSCTILLEKVQDNHKLAAAEGPVLRVDREPQTAGFQGDTVEVVDGRLDQHPPCAC